MSGDRAFRVTVAPAARLGAEVPLTVSPPDGGLTRPPKDGTGDGRGSGSPDARPLVDGEPLAVALEIRDGARAVLIEGEGRAAVRSSIVLGIPVPTAGGVLRREVLADGWRLEVEVEPESRAALRERAHRGRASTVRGGPLELRSVIPGRVVGVSVSTGDEIEAGQQLLVVEAMKMQNELRAPRGGTISRVAVGAGENLEVGDLLVVIE